MLQHGMQQAAWPIGANIFRTELQLPIILWGERKMAEHFSCCIKLFFIWFDLRDARNLLAACTVNANACAAATLGCLIFTTPVWKGFFLLVIWGGGGKLGDKLIYFDITSIKYSMARSLSDAESIDSILNFMLGLLVAARIMSAKAFAIRIK